MTAATAAHFDAAFTKKRIDVTFQVSSGALAPGSTADTVTLSGLRCRATINEASMHYGSSLSLRIEGMTLAMMNRLSVVQGLISPDNRAFRAIAANLITVQAGDDRTGMSTVFSGQIVEAFVDFTGAPNVAFQVLAFNIIGAAVKSVAPTSYGTPVLASTIFKQLATSAGFVACITHGIHDTIPNFYECGSPLQQIDRLAIQIGATYHLTVSNVLHVWSKAYNGSDPTDGATDKINYVPKISKRTGLIGYPSYNQNGVSFTCLFNPAIQFFEQVSLQSEYRPAGWVANQTDQNIPSMPSTGLWQVTRLTHDLATVRRSRMAPSTAFPIVAYRGANVR